MIEAIKKILRQPFGMVEDFKEGYKLPGLIVNKFARQIQEALLKGDEEGLLTEEALIHLNDQWEEEDYDEEMTDAQWELKRWGLIAKAQQALTRQEILEKMDKLRAGRVMLDTQYWEELWGLLRQSLKGEDK